MKKDLDEIKNQQINTYPYIHAAEDKSAAKEADMEEALMMQELYGGPEMFSGRSFSESDVSVAVPKSEADISGITDPDETAQFCEACGRVFAMRLTVCPYCGTIARLQAKPGLEADDG